MPMMQMICHAGNVNTAEIMYSIYDCFAGVQKHSNTDRETSVCLIVKQ